MRSAPSSSPSSSPPATTSIGMTRSPAKTDMLRALGARPVVADALDPDAVARAVAETEPEVIVHQLTALTGDLGLRDMGTPTASSPRPTACAPRAPTTCWPRAGPSASAASSPRASWPSAPTPAPAVRSRPRTTRWTSICRPRGAPDARRHPLSRGRRDRHRLGRGRRAALRRLLRAGHRHQRRSRRLADQGHPEAAVPDRRRRRRCLVVRAHRGRGQRHRGGRRQRRSRHLQRRR